MATDILCTVHSPTTQIYSKLNDILFSRRIETFSLLAGATVAIVLLIVFLSKWSSLLGRGSKKNNGIRTF